MLGDRAWRHRVQQFNADWSRETQIYVSEYSINTKREVYAALLLPNFQVHWHIKVIPVVTSSVAHTPQHQVYESTPNPRTMELEQSFQLIDYN